MQANGGGDALSAGDVTQSVVAVRISAQHFHWKNPWKKQSPYTRVLNGLVVAGRKIMVPGTDLGSYTLVEVQKLGQQDWFPATIKLFDKEIQLAILEVEAPGFWDGMSPLPMAETAPKSGEVQLCSFDSGKFESSKAALAKLEMTTHRSWGLPVLSLKLITSAKSSGEGEVVVAGGRVVGLVASKSKDVLMAISSPMLRQFLVEAAKNPYRGFGTGGFNWSKLTNPALRAFLRRDANEGGIRVNRVVPNESAAGVLEPGDILLQVSDFKLDTLGRIDHPRYGVMPFNILYSDGRSAGDGIDLQFLRAGQRKTARMVLKRTFSVNHRIPMNMVGEKPQYAVVGGLVFQNLSVAYLTTFKDDWQDEAPMRLLIATTMDGDWPTPEHPRTVVLTIVLPDPANLGYQDLHDLIVASVNGVKVRDVEDLKAAFGNHQGAFHVVEFIPGQGARRIVLDVKEAEAASQRVAAY